MGTIITDGEPNKVSCDRCGFTARALPWDDTTAMKPAGWSYAYRPAGKGISIRLMLCPACVPHHQEAQHKRTSPPLEVNPLRDEDAADDYPNMYPSFP